MILFQINQKNLGLKGKIQLILVSQIIQLKSFYKHMKNLKKFNKRKRKK